MSIKDNLSVKTEDLRFNFEILYCLDADDLEIKATEADTENEFLSIEIEVAANS